MPREITAIVTSDLDPDRPPRVERLDPATLRSDRPIYRPLVDALTRGDRPEERLIVASDLRIAPKFRGREEDIEAGVRHLDTLRLLRQEFLQRVLVMERRDGSLWIYDDCAYVAAVQRQSSDTVLPCAVFRDPTR